MLNNNSNFNIKTAALYELYKLPDGRVFEFRYVVEDMFNLILVVIDGVDYYLDKNIYCNAVKL